MKTLWKSVRITVAFCIFFSVFYILVLWIFAQFAGPNKGNCKAFGRSKADPDSKISAQCG